MWTLDPPAVRMARTQVRTALSRKTAPPIYTLSNAEWIAIKDLYALYETQQGQPISGLKPAVLKGCEQTLHDCYSQIQIGGRLEKLRGRLLTGASECPLCGYGDPTTLDHYLPRSKYKALAIYPRNLIPACQPCNRKKGTAAPKGNKGFIHAYYENLPDHWNDEPFLHAKVSYTRGTLRVIFSISHPTLSSQTVERLRYQFEKLELNTRYAAPINNFLFSQKVALLGFTGKDAAKLRCAYLKTVSEQWARDFGLNDWRAAFLRGLMLCSQFCKMPDAYFKNPKRR
ncbi:hypothetical protein AA23498_3397 [Acetobacter nitrogenifigens DSM 23921 = NBRC 105050]|uniref:HNH domain-containing protein n=1 Tax=Acetobacter nitrogenifigens DSM 23921 = NBRC 105050 TaxID=1120919 RepID=A0A511X6J1_9PROT|nr:HNH endonuclease [Acetobacter nitrogenifigens]GBQ99039.1 hypothetical protein AA23498_3397 [Acetobacter nitrogenifigens DSM 23921 = NBRC 105050]GEN58567.1 hypothetical protein ANI02nite_04510 [Acetobacter nitrogenifigens DSM 23921 = NBRC 105050]